MTRRRHCPPTNNDGKGSRAAVELRNPPPPVWAILVLSQYSRGSATRHRACRRATPGVLGGTSSRTRVAEVASSSTAANGFRQPAATALGPRPSSPRLLASRPAGARTARGPHPPGAGSGLPAHGRGPVPNHRHRPGPGGQPKGGGRKHHQLDLPQVKTLRPAGQPPANGGPGRAAVPGSSPAEMRPSPPAVGSASAWP